MIQAVVFSDCLNTALICVYFIKAKNTENLYLYYIFIFFMLVCLHIFFKVKKMQRLIEIRNKLNYAEEEGIP